MIEKYCGNLYKNIGRQKWKVQLIWLQLLFVISSSDGSGESWSFETISESKSAPLQIRLADYESYSLTVPLMEKSITQGSTKIKPNIEFELIPPKSYYGIIAVIQSLSLSVDSSKSCTDYLQFTSSDESSSNQTCGIVNRSDKTISPASLNGQRAFLSSPNSTMRVQLVTGQSPESLQNADTNIVEVTFTAFTDCPSHVDRKKYGLKSCINLISFLTCISEKLFCDNNFNCMVDENFIGDDEDRCAKPGFWQWLMGFR